MTDNVSTCIFKLSWTGYSKVPCSEINALSGDEAYSKDLVIMFLTTDCNVSLSALTVCLISSATSFGVGLALKHLFTRFCVFVVNSLDFSCSNLDVKRYTSCAITVKDRENMAGVQCGMTMSLHASSEVLRSPFLKMGATALFCQSKGTTPDIHATL